jgi:hypothetical protein
MDKEQLQNFVGNICNCPFGRPEMSWEDGVEVG